MPKNTLYLLVGALLVVAIGLGVYVYQEETAPSDGVEISIGDEGVSVEGN
ncbi:hypothetical protein [Aureimonas mangrovi]|nr:hypothetical protein [Aureimonas mangrovi]